MNIDFWVSLVLDLIFTVFVYLFFPILLRFGLKKEYTNKEALKISILNSVIVFILLSIFIYLFIDSSRIASGFPALVYGYVSYSILAKIKKQDIFVDKEKNDLFLKKIENDKKE